MIAPRPAIVEAVVQRGVGSITPINAAPEPPRATVDPAMRRRARSAVRPFKGCCSLDQRQCARTAYNIINAKTYPPQLARRNS
jgi:hypothetical protein